PYTTLFRSCKISKKFLRPTSASTSKNTRPPPRRNSVRFLASFSVDEEARDTNHHSRDSQHQAKFPKKLLPGEQRNRTDHQCGLQYHLAQIKPVRPPPLERHFAFSFLGLSLDVRFLRSVARNFLRIFILQLLHLIRILRRGQRKLVQKSFIAVLTDIFRLIVSPLVGSLRLK